MGARSQLDPGCKSKGVEICQVEKIFDFFCVFAPSLRPSHKYCRLAKSQPEQSERGFTMNLNILQIFTPGG